MQELEKLLNSLIQRGRKPWGKEYTAIDIIQDGREECLMFWDVPKRQMKSYTFRSLVSIKSWLWQFVCDKELVQHKTSEKIINRYIKETVERESWNITEADVVCTDLDPEYRLLESALIPEEELGKFLVENIKVEWIDWVTL